MPYVEKKTWIQMAPPIRGLSLKESQSGFQTRGMGQASCPSLEQLLGISDSSDPCQLTSTGGIMTGPTPTSAELVASGASPAISANTLTTWLQANQSLVLIGGISLLGVVFLSKALR